MPGRKKKSLYKEEKLKNSSELGEREKENTFNKVKEIPNIPAGRKTPLWRKTGYRGYYFLSVL